MAQQPPAVRAHAQNFEYGNVLSDTNGAAGKNGADLANPTCRGVKVIVDITAITGTTPTLTVTVQGKDPASGKYFTLLASAALNAAGTTVLTVYPAVTVAANAAASDVVPRTFRVISAVAGTTPQVTYTVGAVGIV